jgi:hypothetical protein
MTQTQSESRQSSRKGADSALLQATTQVREQAFSSIPHERISCSAEELRLGDRIFDDSGSICVTRLEKSSVQGRPGLRMEVFIEPGTQIDQVRRPSFQPSESTVKELFEAQQSTGARWLVKNTVDGREAYWPVQITQEDKNEFLLEINYDYSGHRSSEQKVASGTEKVMARLTV